MREVSPVFQVCPLLSVCLPFWSILLNGDTALETPAYSPILPGSPIFFAVCSFDPMLFLVVWLALACLGPDFISRSCKSLLFTAFRASTFLLRTLCFCIQFPLVHLRCDHRVSSRFSLDFTRVKTSALSPCQWVAVYWVGSKTARIRSISTPAWFST